MGKGLGFVPTPKANTDELRLDARRVVNKLLYKKPPKEDEEEDVIEGEIDAFQLPPQLRQTSYFQAAVVNVDPEINLAINHINTNVNSTHFNSKKSSPCSNLSQQEMVGLKSIQRKVNEQEIGVCKADKGGAILIVPANYLYNKVKA